MLARCIPLIFLLLLAMLGGCSRDDPQAALEKAARQLQAGLEEKDLSSVLEQLHGDFQAGDGLDRAWAERSMRLAFLRHRNIRIIALRHDSRLDSSYADRGYTEAEVTMSGAEGLIPQRAGHYSVKLEWWLENDEWRLARLSWD
ncbi:hypothetical protein [Pseudomonas mangrovi]|uniref:Nuclear transport factor 2 family protein n=1 Tax=Pseudomonas mangrovi TaxID=2161748 RepID=A0A2T5P5G8_9PSED|nr:hypothetical protein [Pseudomonas mangrovi]PTU72945.1 hypothetical protein DBO85_16970 [Pseudomonas mangrovi]